jgi:hypothetical protein
MNLNENAVKEKKKKKKKKSAWDYNWLPNFWG